MSPPLRCARPPPGGNACSPAKPVPRRFWSLGHLRGRLACMASRSAGPRGLPCAVRCARGARKLASLKQCAPLVPAPFRCSARQHGRRRVEIRDQAAALGRGLFNPECHGVVRFAVMRWRVAQGWADQGWRCLSEASLARPRPDRATQRTRRAAHSARLSFAYFSLAKQRKVRRPPGRDPACHACH